MNQSGIRGLLRLLVTALTFKFIRQAKTQSVRRGSKHIGYAVPTKGQSCFLWLYLGNLSFVNFLIQYLFP